MKNKFVSFFILFYFLLLISSCESNESLEVDESVEISEEFVGDYSDEDELSEYEKALKRQQESKCETDLDCINYYGELGFECLPFGDDTRCIYTVVDYNLTSLIGNKCINETDSGYIPEIPGYSLVIKNDAPIDFNLSDRYHLRYYTESLNDECVNHFILLEYFCNEEGFLAYEEVNCKDYCISSGKCEEDLPEYYFACSNLDAKHHGDACSPPLSYNPS